MWPTLVSVDGANFEIPKAQGEAIVRSIFPETTIVRPAPLFGFEDRLLHKLAGVTNVFTSNHMQERYWPVHVSGPRAPQSVHLSGANKFRQSMLGKHWR